MTTVASGEGLECLVSKSDKAAERLVSKAGEAVWAGDVTPVADEEAEEGLPFRVFGVEGEDEAEDILCKARTGPGHAAVAKGRAKGPGAARAGVRARGWKGARGARVSLRDVV